MKYSVEVEKLSSVLRKFIIKVPADEVRSRFDQGLIAVQKNAKIKGFREGHVPISVVKQYYGDDVRHRVFHNLIDESFDRAVQDQKLRAVGRPQIDTPEHKTGAGDHDHSLKENEDLTFTATFEVMPEIQVKGYTGLALTRETSTVSDENVEKVVANLRDSQAQLTPASGGLALADGTESSRPVEKGDFVDTQFSGGLVTENGVEPRDEMKGTRLVEIGSQAFIPGFEEQLIGMRRGETKTFRISFPADYHSKEIAGREAEFTVTAQEVKEKNLPPLDDDFAKQLGYSDLADLRVKAREFLVRESEQESDRTVRADLLSKIIEKNPFDVPLALIEGQTRALAQEWAQELKKQGFAENMIQEAIMKELDQLKKRAEGQVRTSLILETIAEKEQIAITSEEMDQEVVRLSTSMQIEEEKMRDFYAKNPGRKEDLEFRLRQERTIKFLLDKSKIKSVEAEVK